MKEFQIKRANGSPMQWHMQWPQRGENADDALARWEHCFGKGFVVVDEPGKGVAR